MLQSYLKTFKYKNIHEIKLTVNGEKTPLSAQSTRIKTLFDVLWKELDIYENNDLTPMNNF